MAILKAVISNDFCLALTLCRYHCHGGENDPALPEDIRNSTTCQESSVPDFIRGFLVFLWIMMGLCIVAFLFVIYYLMFMKRGKDKVLKIKNQV